MTLVVVVACEPNMRRMEKEVLKLEGYRVVTAGDGRNALRILRRTTCQAIVLLDIMMPYVNGLEVLKRLDASPRWRARYAVILQSAFANLEMALATLTPDGTLTLPFTVEQFIAAVEHGRDVPAARRRPVP